MKTQYLGIYILGLTLFLCTISCKKTQNVTPSLSVEDLSSKVISFPIAETRIQFKVNANTSWTITNSVADFSSAFYTLSRTSGSKNDSIVTITAKQNLYPYMRYDTLYIAASSVVDTLYIEQAAVATSTILLVSFQNLYSVSGVDSIVSADMTILDNGVTTTYSNISIDNTDKASFRSDNIPITSTTKIIAAVFKNQNGKIRNWWNWNQGESIPMTIDIEDSKYYFSDGDGTNANPYIISNPAQMNKLRKSYYEGQFIEQDRDIDFTDAIGLVKLNDTSFDFSQSDTFAVFYNTKTGWIPIGRAGSGGGLPFKGTYDGKGFSIKGLFMNRTATTGTQVTGLFGVVAGGTIQNVIIDNSCLFLGTNSIGSIVGSLQNGNIQECANYAVVKGSQYVGGIVGSMAAGTIEKSFNKGKVIAQSYVGGLVGGVSDGSNIKNSYNNAEVNGNWWVGGLLGYSAGNSCSIENSYNAGQTITAIAANTTAIGGILGGISTIFANGISFTNCYYLQEGDINNNINGVGGNTTTTGITAKDKASLQGQAAALGTEWKVDNGQNDGFPILNWQ